VENRKIRFDEKQDRYITKGIKENVSPYLYHYLFELIDTMKVAQRDCLQVFDLKRVPGQENTQIVIHTQECPRYKKRYVFQTAMPQAIGKISLLIMMTHTVPCFWLMSID